MFRTLEATLEPKGFLRFTENLVVTRPLRVLVTLLDGPDETVDSANILSIPSHSILAAQQNGPRILELLRSPDFANYPPGDPDEIEATINEIRDAWGE